MYRKGVQLRAMAKINLGLDVIRKREDGYHDLRMIMQTIRVHDQIRLQVTDESGIRMETNLGFLPTDANNLAWRAASLLMEEFGVKEGLFIRLDKHIPVAAGLAGGSSDAAAVLVGVNRLFHLQLSMEELMKRGKSLGADVPYCVMRGTALAEGIGEILTPLPAMPDCYILLAKPSEHISTRFVYTNLRADELKEHPDIDGQLQALREGNLKLLAEKMGNVLETVTIPACPLIEQIKTDMRHAGALGSMMSGSGPTVFGLFETYDMAQEALQMLREKYRLKVLYITTPYP
ncbi:MAG: 4-(cytidine 5'-diphospho)-2-C-methyl-D-erythritol kinase [Lachnospiraceae bacterium]|nr:4-(cytidine 5'-diphospho)-2-C-methyl-D-erythritol kinase [Lachnospiraceae bacterium]